MGKIVKKTLGVVEVISSQPSDLRKFFKPSVSRGKTVWPKTAADLLRYGVRWDYDGIVTHENKECHKFQLQPNDGKIPSTIKQWRENNGVKTMEGHTGSSLSCIFLLILSLMERF